MEQALGTVGRFEVVVEQGIPHGDLYELEQETYYRVVDKQLDRVVMTFEGRMEANLSRKTGLWDGCCFYGVCGFSVAPDDGSVSIKDFDGREELVPLPE